MIRDRMLLSSFVSLVCAALSYGQEACESPLYGELGGMPVEDAPRGIALGDFDGDRELDLAVTFGAPGRTNGVAVRLGDGLGSFAAPISYPTGGAGPFYLEACDLNGDGVDDLIVPNEASDTIGVLLSDGQGGFAPVANYFTSARPWSVSTGDVNGDGHQDVVVACNEAAVVEVFLGSADGGLTFQGAIDAPPLVRRALLVDVDGDGLLDLLSAGAGTGSLELRLGAPQGVFGSPTASDPGGPVRWFEAGDVDSDGIVDVVACIGGTVEALVLLRRTPFGGFGPAETITESTSPRSVAISDLDFDGDQDLFFVNDESFPVGALVLEGDGTGSFSNAATFPFVAGFDAAVGDLDGDGSTEVLCPWVDVDQILVAPSACRPRVGTSDGVILSTEFIVHGVGASGIPSDPIKEVRAGDTLALGVRTTEASLVGAPTCLGIQVSGSPSYTPFSPSFPWLYLDPTATPEIVIVSSGPIFPFPTPIIASIPPGFEGRSIIAQCFTLAPNFAANGFVAASDAHELRVR